MRMKAKFLQAAVVLVLTFSWCKAASAPLVLYDNFDTSVIDPFKWVGAQNFDPDLRETLRELAPVPGVPNDRRLHLMHRAYSATTDDSGNSGGLFGLSFPNPSAVTAISFQLTVNRIGVVACSTNPTSEDVTAAEFRGSFFSMDASPTSSSDDVQADIGIERGVGESTPTVVGFVQEANGTVLGFQVLGTAELGSTHTLFVQWDQPNHRFVFQLDNGAQVFEPYSVQDTSPPFSPFKNIDLARVVPHCTSTPRPFAVVDAEFDNVFVK